MRAAWHWRGAGRTRPEPRLFHRGPVVAVGTADRGGHPRCGRPDPRHPVLRTAVGRRKLAIPADIRTWNEDEEPLKLVADFLRERSVAGGRSGSRRPTASSSSTGLQQRCPASRRHRQPGRSRLRMIKSPAELALMQAAADITLLAYRHAGAATAEGMTPAEIGAFDRRGATGAGRAPTTAALVLLGEASRLSARQQTSRKRCKRGEVVLIDCGCTVHGYQSDISRTLRLRRRPDARAAQGVGPGAPRPADRHRRGQARRARGKRR